MYYAFRRFGAPAYYLGRPADTWRAALRRRRHRRTPVAEPTHRTHGHPV
jgi:hypothetical protein